MLSRKELTLDRALCEDRAVGAMIGLAIGDSFGDAARKEDNRANYGFTTDFNSGASWSTDDTEFALLCAQTLIGCKGELTSQHVVDAWMTHVARQDEFKRGGASEITAVKNLRRGMRPPESGRFNSYHQSDGAAMRIAPVGVICAGDPERATKMAETEACISHHQDGIWAAQAVAVAVSTAMVDGTFEEIMAQVLRAIPHDSWLYANMVASQELVEHMDYDIMNTWMKLHDMLADTYRATSAEAIPAVFACLKLAHGDFKSGMVLASNYGRDADTIGAVAGAVLGAKFGLHALPEAWVKKTRYPTGTCLEFCKGVDIVETGKQLATLIL